MPMLAATVAEAGETFHALTAVAVTVGPGAFTGIRIGLAAARGIGLAAAIPVVGVTTFAAVAQAIPEAERIDRDILALLDSKRGDVFVQQFTPERVPVGPPAILSPAAVSYRSASGSFILAGDGISIVRPYMEGINLSADYSTAAGPVDARWVAQLAAQRAADRSGQPPIPLYLRAPAVRTPTHASSSSAAAVKP